MKHQNELRAFIPKIKTSIENIIVDFKHLKSCHSREALHLIFMMQGEWCTEPSGGCSWEMNLNFTKR